MERVVVTGLGVASPLGCTVEDFWAHLVAGGSGVVALAEPEYAKLRSRIGARLAGFDEMQHFDSKEVRRMSRSSLMALVASAQAVDQARLTVDGVDPRDVGVIIGSSIGGFAASDHFFKTYYERGAASPYTIPISMNVGPSSNVSIRFGFQGPLMTVDAACASAAHSIGYCYNLIRTGMLDVAVTGGSDCPFAPGVVSAWCALRALSERNDDPAAASRPFSRDRDGMVLGEGAGVLILESETSALRRGQPILAEVLGYGATGDSHHLTQPSPQGPARAMARALKDAGLTIEDVDWINAHGTATDWNDKTETAAIKHVFGERAWDTPVVGLKGALGHAIAASAALQAVSSILSLRDQLLPPTINYRVPDPDCDLDYVTEGARRQPVKTILNNSFAFGGSNSALVFGRYEPAEA
jgi:beta-ketoacyl-acyl-carrier-protein synthase II